MKYNDIHLLYVSGSQTKSSKDKVERKNCFALVKDLFSLQALFDVIVNWLAFRLHYDPLCQCQNALIHYYDHTFNIFHIF